MDVSRPAPFLNTEDRTYMLCARLDVAAASYISKLQHSLTTQFPGVFWAMPEPSLHITLFELMQRGVFSIDKDVFFEQHRANYIASLRAIFSSQQPITLRFDQVVVSRDAVTLQSGDVDDMNALRKQIGERLLLPSETKLPPPVVHSSFMRFTAEVELDRVRKALINVGPMPTMTVSAFELRKTFLQPMQRFEVLETFDLNS